MANFALDHSRRANSLSPTMTAVPPHAVRFHRAPGASFSTLAFSPPTFSRALLDALAQLLGREIPEQVWKEIRPRPCPQQQPENLTVRVKNLLRSFSIACGHLFGIPDLLSLRSLKERDHKEAAYRFGNAGIQLLSSSVPIALCSLMYNALPAELLVPLLALPLGNIAARTALSLARPKVLRTSFSLLLLENLYDRREELDLTAAVRTISIREIPHTRSRDSLEKRWADKNAYLLRVAYYTCLLTEEKIASHVTDTAQKLCSMKPSELRALLLRHSNEAFSRFRITLPLAFLIPNRIIASETAAVLHSALISPNEAELGRLARSLFDIRDVANTLATVFNPLSPDFTTDDYEPTDNWTLIAELHSACNAGVRQGVRRGLIRGLSVVARQAQER